MAKAKNPQVTIETINEINNLGTLQEKKQFLLDYIGEVQISSKTINKTSVKKLLDLRARIAECESDSKFDYIIWNMLLSGEKMSTVLK